MHYYLLILPLLILLSATLTSSQSPPLKLAIDYGRIIVDPSIAVLEPRSSSDIAHLIASASYSPSSNNNGLTVAPRGAGHSIYGQAQAPGGTVVDMRKLPGRIDTRAEFADVGGGALWVDVLTETLKRGLTPRSWTDYLYLTVGGTLSVAGISGQTFKYGPQIANVLELDVITGKGELLTCSSDENPDLFYGVLGGFGQFGVITRARIILKPALKMAKRVTINYDDFDQFTRDQELLISTGEVDYLEGFLVFKNNGSVGYTMELAIYYDDAGAAQKILDHLLSRLKLPRSSANAVELSYFDFLNRVGAEEEELRKKGLWDVAHPWLNLFLPKTQLGQVKDLLLQTISDKAGGGPIIIYPFFRDKWNPKMSAVLPEGDAGDNIVYVMSILRSTMPSCSSGTPCLDALLAENQKMIKAATGIGGKQYMPFYENEDGWRTHFGRDWQRFNDLKSRFDPLHILAPGQRIFKRTAAIVG